MPFLLMRLPRCVSVLGRLVSSGKLASMSVASKLKVGEMV